ncbi:hypothetical protein C0991_012445 [Blastosporella zonata]|nr:hypothetical protein C0991_012445 [Blastosporella zonata]
MVTSQQIAAGPLDATFNYDPVITGGTASVYINGTYAFLKYAFKDVNQPFSSTINLGQVGGFWYVYQSSKANLEVTPALHLQILQVSSSDLQRYLRESWPGS